MEDIKPDWFKYADPTPVFLEKIPIRETFFTHTGYLMMRTAGPSRGLESLCVDINTGKTFRLPDSHRVFPVYSRLIYGKDKEYIDRVIDKAIELIEEEER